MRVSQDMRVLTSVDEFKTYIDHTDFATVSKRTGKRKGIEYLDLTATLDIETTNTENDGFLYTVQFNVAGKNILLRYVEDFIECANYLCEKYQLGKDRKCVFYIHNLGYEHMYLTQILEKVWGVKNMLLVKKRKPLVITYNNGIEFRDSLRLFQKSLEGATKGMPHAKMAGDLNYEMYRTPDTPLSPDEWNYCINDVQGLYEAIESLKEYQGYNQATIPYTNTGMVIKEVNDQVRDDPKFRQACNKLILNKDQLVLAYKCMGGGDTHGSRWKAGRVYENCNSVDFKSAHPSHQLLHKFPMGKPFELPELCSEEMLKSFIESGYGWIGKLYISDFKCKWDNPNPTLSSSKCEDMEGIYGFDNGRVLGAQHAVCYMDSNDYQRFIEGYDYDAILGVEVLGFELKPLPESFRMAILEKFKVKETAKKGPERDFAKVCVNTIFGACAQKSVRDTYEIENYDCLDAEPTKWEDLMASYTEEKVKNTQRQKFPFLWGLWTSSLSRLYLWRLIKAIGWEKIIYWDTDSGKYEGDRPGEVNKLNDEIIHDCTEASAVVTGKDGEPIYIGIAEDEHPGVQYGYRRFTFLHAKCYAAESWDDDSQSYRLETTIAGVGKKEGIAGLKGDISNLKDGLKISPAGGQCLTYHDLPVYTREFMRKTMCASFIYMTPREYEVKHDMKETFFKEEYEIIVE